MSVDSWHQFKQFIEHVSGISMDALHVIVGVILFLLAAAATKRSIISPLPWFIVLLLAFANEAYDMMIEIWPSIGSQLGEGVKDIALTMTLPTLLLYIARRHPHLLTDQISE